MAAKTKAGFPINPFLRKPDNPNFLRRARHHDYHRPARYLVTLMKAETTGRLCRIIGNPSKEAKGTPRQPHAELTSEGAIIEAALREWQPKFPQINIAAYAIMPDHLHLCLHVTDTLPCGLSTAVASLMGSATRLRSGHNQGRTPLWSERSEDKTGAEAAAGSHGAMAPFFAKGFNDRIAYTPEQWERQRRYVADNPRRYLIKKLHPDYYYARWEIHIDSRRYAAVGNIMLLKNPDLQVVRFSRRFETDRFEAMVEGWKHCVANNGVLVSPFIHPREAEMRKYALEHGEGIIRICDTGYGNRMVPQGYEFEYIST